MATLLPRSLRSSLITLALLAAAWLLLAPTQLGGQVSWLVVNGNSMEPLYHRGDLVLLRAEPQYQVGQVLAYRHPEIGPVIHRAIGRDGALWVFQGDHNTFIDPYRPHTSDLIGRAVLWVPALGSPLIWLRTPAVAAALAFGMGLLMVQIHSTRRPGRARPTPAAARIPAQAGLVVTAAGLLLSLALGVAALVRPAQRATSVELPYQQAGRFSYTAAAPPGIYDGGAAATGEPVFWKLSDTLDVAFAYTLTSDAPADIRGTARLDAELGSADGWHRTLALSPARSFAGGAVELRGQVDLASVKAMVAELERQAELPKREYTLRIRPTVTVDGALGGQPLHESFAPALTFQSDEYQLRMVRDPERDALAPAKAGALTRTSIGNEQIFPGVPLGVVPARWLAALGLLISGGALAALAGPLLRRLRGDPAAQIRLRYGGQICDVAAPARSLAQAIELGSIEALARLAERSGAPLLHEQGPGQHRYFTIVGEQTYVYLADDPAPPTFSQPVAAEPAAVVFPSWQDVFLSTLEQSGLASEASRAAGVSLVAAYRQRETDRRFASAWDAARTRALAQLR
ncbi:signal peptidase I [Chloroflexia bacterium SDU3-3]|nr:signal peptidase I [Chloroflexia bacterium SDU3-3]